MQAQTTEHTQKKTKEKTKRHATYKILSDKCFVFINFQTRARTISSDRNQIQFMLWKLDFFYFAKRISNIFISIEQFSAKKIY